MTEISNKEYLDALNTVAEKERDLVIGAITSLNDYLECTKDIVDGMQEVRNSLPKLSQSYSSARNHFESVVSQLTSFREQASSIKASVEYMLSQYTISDTTATNLLP